MPEQTPQEIAASITSRMPESCFRQMRREWLEDVISAAIQARDEQRDQEIAELKYRLQAWNDTQAEQQAKEHAALVVEALRKARMWVDDDSETIRIIDAALAKAEPHNAAASK